MNPLVETQNFPVITLLSLGFILSIKSENISLFLNFHAHRFISPSMPCFKAITACLTIAAMQNEGSFSLCQLGNIPLIPNGCLLTSDRKTVVLDGKLVTIS